MGQKCFYVSLSSIVALPRSISRNDVGSLPAERIDMGKGMVCFSLDHLKDVLKLCYDKAIYTNDTILFERFCDAISIFHDFSLVSDDLYDFSVELGMQLCTDRLRIARDELEKLSKGVNSYE